MTSDLLVCVLCYSGDLAQVRHQLDSYTQFEAPVLILSPEDAPALIDHPQVTNLQAGLSGWKGRHVCRKLVQHWQLALEQPQQWIIFFESDSVSLSSRLSASLFERTDVLWGHCLNEPGEPGAHYQAPWFGHRTVWERMVEGSEEHFENICDNWEQGSEGGGEGAGNAEFTTDLANRIGMTCDTFLDSIWCYRENAPQLFIDAALRAPGVPSSYGGPIRSDDIKIFSGVKNPQTYDAMKKAYADRPATVRVEI